MALVKCSECGNNVSDRASRCPKCGCPIEFISEVVEDKKEEVVEEVEVKEEALVKKEEVPVLEETPKKKMSGFKIFLIAVGVMILIVGGIFFLLFAASEFDVHQLKCNLFGCSVNTDTNSEQYKGKYIRITNEYINIRTDHALNATAIGKVLKGEVYEIFDHYQGYSYNWSYICIDGTNYGWVATPIDGEQYYEIIESNDIS